MEKKNLKKEKKLPDIDSWVRAQLRNSSVKWPGRTKAMQNGRVERGLYKCAACKKTHRKGQFHLDHKDPVIPLEGIPKRKDGSNRIDFNIFIDRLFVTPDKLQILCLVCHASKCELESGMRAFYKKEQKSKKD